MRDVLGAEQPRLQVAVYLLLGLAAQVHRWQAFRPARCSAIREPEGRGTTQSELPKRVDPLDERRLRVEPRQVPHAADQRPQILRPSDQELELQVLDDSLVLSTAAAVEPAVVEPGAEIVVWLTM